MPSAIITLTTDFGASDGYVGAMKGVILGINPQVSIVDVTHNVPVQDIAHGAFVLGATCRYFPGDAVHVCVVDPEVGTSRRALLLVTPTGRFVAPDNGLLTYLLLDPASPDAAGPGPGADVEFKSPITVMVPDGCTAYSLTRCEYWRHPVSDTFHGRDVFAPIAAHLSAGVPPGQLGEETREVVALNLGPPQSRRGAIEGRVVFVDHFGNLVSNIPSSAVRGSSVEVEIKGRRVKGLSRTFAGGQGLRALIGSHGHLEIAESNGSAAARLSADVGTRLRVTTPGVQAGGQEDG